MLNILGGVFIPGISDMVPNKMTIPANVKKNIPEIEIETPQVDLKLIEYLHKSYQALDDNHKRDKNFNVDKEGMELSKQNIHLIYANSGIPYFHEGALESISRKPVEPLVKSTPVYDKCIFYTQLITKIVSTKRDVGMGGVPTKNENFVYVLNMALL
jgi:hypothetical protein